MRWRRVRARSASAKSPLASVTSLHYDGDVLVGVGYREPAAGL